MGRGPMIKGFSMFRMWLAVLMAVCIGAGCLIADYLMGNLDGTWHGQWAREIAADLITGIVAVIIWRLSRYLLGLVFPKLRGRVP